VAAPPNAMTFNVLLKAKGGMFIAHCMELDIVAEAPTLAEVKEEIGDLIAAAVDYAFSHDNVAHLYHPAPPEVWEEFYRCEQDGFEQIPVTRGFADAKQPHRFVPPWIIAKTCRAATDCSV
jgi:NTP pyrophosphatase (non-canonical NTP hydrolase)